MGSGKQTGLQSQLLFTKDFAACFSNEKLVFWVHLLVAGPVKRIANDPHVPKYYEAGVIGRKLLIFLILGVTLTFLVH